MGRLSQESLDRIHERRRRLNSEMDQIVIEGLTRLGGSFQGRIMQLRRHLPEPLREAQIKDAIRRLVNADRIRTTGEYKSGKGILYEIVN